MDQNTQTTENAKSDELVELETGKEHGGLGAGNVGAQRVFRIFNPRLSRLD